MPYYTLWAPMLLSALTVVCFTWTEELWDQALSEALRCVLEQSKKDGKDQETIQSSTTPCPVYPMGKYEKYNKHHQQEPRSQPFPSRWPQGSNEHMPKHEKYKTRKTQMIHKRSTTLERSVKIFYWSHFILCLVWVRPRKTHPDITEKLLTYTLRIKWNKVFQMASSYGEGGTWWAH